MKRLLISAGLILLLAGLAAWHVLFLEREVQRLTGQLEQAQTCLDGEDWTGALELTRSAWEHWESLAFYLHVTLHHEDIDGVSTSFQEAMALLEQRQQPAEYASANARLIQQLNLLSEGELPSVKNLF